MDITTIKEWIGIIGALFGIAGVGGGIWAWRYAPRRERSNVENLELDADLKRTEILDKTLAQIQAGLSTISILRKEREDSEFRWQQERETAENKFEKELDELRANFVILRQLTRRLYKSIETKPELTPQEKELLNGNSYTNIENVK